MREGERLPAREPLHGSRDVALRLLGECGLGAEELTRLERRDLRPVRRGARRREPHVRHGKRARIRSVPIAGEALHTPRCWDRLRVERIGGPPGARLEPERWPLVCTLGRRRRDSSYTRVDGRCGQPGAAARARPPDARRRPRGSLNERWGAASGHPRLTARSVAGSSSCGDMGSKQERRAARALVAGYHEARLAELLDHVADALDRYRAGELDAFEVDDVIHRYERAARELSKFCWLGGGLRRRARRAHARPHDRPGRAGRLVAARRPARALRLDRELGNTPCRG